MEKGSSLAKKSTVDRQRGRRPNGGGGQTRGRGMASGLLAALAGAGCGGSGGIVPSTPEKAGTSVRP